jgi:phage major head subunit gpT-like protein
MPRIITPSVLDAIFQGFNFQFNGGLKSVAPTWSRVAMQTNSTAAAENYGWLGQMPRIREWAGDRVANSLDSFGYQIKNRTFESTITVKREQIEDDSYGLFSPLFTGLGESVGLFPDELVYGLFGAGFASACFDGQNFFDTNHPVKDANGNVTFVSNVVKVGSPSNAPWFLLDTTKVVKPFIFQNRRKFEFVSKTNPNDSDRVFERNEYTYGVDGRCNAGYGFWQTAYASQAPLTRANFRAARAAMRNFKGDFGRPLGIEPNLLVVGLTLADVANDLIKSKFLPVDGAPGEPVLAGAVGMIDNTDMNSIEVFTSRWLA